MRWILDALHYARDRQVRGGIPLAGVFRFTNFICKKGCCPDTRDNGKCEGECRCKNRSFTFLRMLVGLPAKRSLNMHCSNTNVGFATYKWCGLFI